jgi:hypothetical protein
MLVWAAGKTRFPNVFASIIAAFASLVAMFSA